MMVKILFFSLLRDVVSADEIEWEVPADGVTVGELLDQLYSKWASLREWDTKILVALDLDYVERNAVVMPGQEMAVMPPVQGG
jgi:molybdopterin converting factor small subunit